MKANKQTFDHSQVIITKLNDMLLVILSDSSYGL